MTALIAIFRQSRLLRFLIVGGFGFIVAEAVLWLLLHLVHADSSAAWLASFLCAATFTWWGNRNLTFADRKARGMRDMLIEYAKFLASNALGGAVNFALFKALEIYGPAPLNDPLAALACGVLAGLVFNFAMSKVVVFRS